MSRHNRRRTRGHKPSHRSPFELALSATPIFPVTAPVTGYFLNSSASHIIPAAAHANNNPIGACDSVAFSWQRALNKKNQSLVISSFPPRRQQWKEAEQMRIFGGSSGEEDDDGLYAKMMAFFGGLDFIEA